MFGINQLKKDVKSLREDVVLLRERNAVLEWRLKHKPKHSLGQKTANGECTDLRVQTEYQYRGGFGPCVSVRRYIYVFEKKGAINATLTLLGEWEE